MSVRTVKFGEARPLAGEQLKQYKTMQKAERFENAQGDFCSVSTTFDFDGDGKTEYLVADKLYGPLTAFFGYGQEKKDRLMPACRTGKSLINRPKGLVNDVQLISLTQELHALVDKKAISMENFVTEIRCGDFDKDGDIDVAVKIDSGAVYLFPNLTK